jgi:hypothetical protein
MDIQSKPYHGQLRKGKSPVKLNSNDVAVLEQALQEAINNGYDYRSVMAYRGILSKLQAVPIGSDDLRVDVTNPGAVGHAADVEGGPMAGSVLSVGESPDAPQIRDGFRYDYDDNENLL